MEEEFKAEGIKIQWNFLRGAGPGVNELFANGLADFGWGLGESGRARARDHDRSW
ncbi:MAG TPA: hypothetical protein VEQ59_24870 [Polyangiaceae bacterium]|nr:hypothetical protein [Polyangiaceae bacterium]